MKSNTQTAKITAITEKRWLSVLMLDVKHTTLAYTVGGEITRLKNRVTK